MKGGVSSTIGKTGDGILEACRRLGVRPEETIMVGDSRFDEGAAKAAGTGFRWFTSFAELKLDG